MANEAGFLDRIGVGSADERAIRESQQTQLFARAGGLASLGFALGRKASPITHGAAAGLGGLFSEGGRSVGGIKQNFVEGASNREEQLDAQAAGINVQQLRARRELRNTVANSNIVNDGSFEAQESMARLVAQRAGELGDVEAQGQALAELSRVRRERKEFEKLSAQTRQAEAEATVDENPDVFIAGDTNPRSGQVVPGDPITGELGGVVVADEAGNPQFVPVGQFSFVDPRSGSQRETLDQRWRKIVPSKDRSNITNTIVAGRESVQKYRRVLSTLVDLSEQGGVNSVISTSGRVLSKIDNLVRNVEGIVQPMLGAFTQYNGERVRSSEARKDAVRRGLDPASDFWKDANGNSILPPEFQDASAAAQQHRAMVMELAYMAARLAEPSNRGLSDNDIKNALVRIAGDTSNPQVMVRRFAEMMVDTSDNIENMIDVHRGFFPDVGRQEFDNFVGGEALVNYRNDMVKLKEDFGFTVDKNGRTTFGRPLDSDVQPGQGIPELDPAPGGTPVDIDALSDEEFLDQF